MSSQPPRPARPAPTGVRALLGVYAELGKARLGALVVLTTMAGFAIAARGRFEFVDFFWTVLGTALSALGANGLNQVWERERDRLMHRTRLRPLPSGRLGVGHALAVSLLWSVAGVGLLAVAVNMLTALLSLGVIALYVLVYTPLKPRSSVNTLVGAVCGAIPPMMGWTGATGSVAPGAWVLGATLFAWQIPHFLALAWLYREDYQRGGYKMLPISDESGRVTCWMTVLYSLALIPVGLMASAAGLAGWFYSVGAVMLGGLMVERSLRLLTAKSDRRARQVFFASLLYLPLLLGLMVFDDTPILTKPQPVERAASIALR